jgi:hypothetical protein
MKVPRIHPWCIVEDWLTGEASPHLRLAEDVNDDVCQSS